MKKIIMVIGAGLLTASMAHAQKAPFSYNYLELGYFNGKQAPRYSSGADNDATGYGVGGSVSLNDDIFLLGEYSDGAEKDVGGDNKRAAYSLGIGGRLSAGKQTDLTANVLYKNWKFSGGQTGTNTGYEIGLGLRHAATDMLELHGGVSVTMMESGNYQNTGFSAGLRYKLADKVSLGVAYTSDMGDYPDRKGVLGTLRFDF